MGTYSRPDSLLEARIRRPAQGIEMVDLQLSKYCLYQLHNLERKRTTPPWRLHNPSHTLIIPCIVEYSAEPLGPFRDSTHVPCKTSIYPAGRALHEGERDGAEPGEPYPGAHHPRLA